MMSHKLTVIFCGNGSCQHNGRGQCDIGTASTKEDILSFSHVIDYDGISRAEQQDIIKCLSFVPFPQHKGGKK